MNEEEMQAIGEKVAEVLHGIYDPEIPVDIFELGLIYEIEVYPVNNVYVKMNAIESPIVWLSQNLNGTCDTQFSNAAELNKSLKNYAKNSVSLIDYKGPLFKSIELKNIF